MSEQTATRIRVFSLSEANACLPLLRVIVRDIVQMSNSILECRQRLDFLREGRDDFEQGMYEDELDHMEDSLESDAVQLKAYIAELHELGVEIKSLTEGQIDFPSLIGGQMVYLCWKFDEPTVDYWRELEDKFDKRQSIDLMFQDLARLE